MGKQNFDDFPDTEVSETITEEETSQVEEQNIEKTTLEANLANSLFNSHRFLQQISHHIIKLDTVKVQKMIEQEDFSGVGFKVKTDEERLENKKEK